ncbi:MAG: beta-propeller domain-containing protein, partial [Nanoarchaeota archaeon]
MNKNTILTMIVVLSIVGAILLVGCTQQPISDRNPPGDNFLGVDLSGNMSVGNTTLTSSQEIKKFNNVNELKQFLLQSQLSQGQSYNSFDSMMVKSSAAPTAAGAERMSADMGGGGGAVDYSQTNVQVAGVDEADFVKNDDKYIYMIAGNKLVIVDSYQGEDAEIISKTSIPGMYDSSQEQEASKAMQYYYSQPEAK